MAEMTTMMEEYYELEEANPARENLDGPILESSWEEKEVVITNSIDTKCMVSVSNICHIDELRWMMS